MKVVYDITVLGQGYNKQLSRTGVYRMVEAIGKGLAGSTECALRFYSNTNLRTVLDCAEYLSGQPTFNNVPFLPMLPFRIKPGQPKNKSDILPNLKDLLQKGGVSDVVYNLKLGKRLKRYIKRQSKKNLISFNNFVTDKIILRQTEIYHSPFLQIPGYIREHSEIKTFLTVCDLIPVLYPQFFTNNVASPVMIALANLTKKDWIICISESTRNDLLNNFPIMPEQTFVTPLAASPDIFYPQYDTEILSLVKQKYGIPSGKYILSVNTLEPRKNTKRVIEAFNKLLNQERTEDLYLVLVGANGWLNTDIIKAIELSNSGEKRVIVTGYAADEDLAALYSGALAFLYPSIYEGFGLPPLEAMQCGIPVITSNTSSLPEVVGDAGIMIDPTDVDLICQNMLKLYRDPELRKTLSEKSIVQAKKFSWENCIKKTLDAYKFALLN